jgi:hypothetical protein
MKTIFSQAYHNRHSNFGALLTALASTVGNLIPEGACFGDAACQANRELQIQAILTNAQANLAATNVAAMNEQNEAKQTQVMLYLGLGFGVIVLVLGVLFSLKK